MKLDRTKLTIKTLKSGGDDEFVDATQSECVSMVWPLTEEIWEVYKPGSAMQPLQRNIVLLKKLDTN